MIDSHCHLDFERFDDDRAEVIARARQVGVTGFVCAGVDPLGWARQDEVARAHPEIFMTYGLHPTSVAMMAPEAVDDALAELSTRDLRAVGEAGLDLSRYTPRGSLDQQLRVFRAQLALARERNVPIVLHILGAHGPALDTLRRDGLPAAGGMIHSYSGSKELVSRYEALGLHISFAGGVTRPTARKVLEAVREVSPERLMVETDCPDQIPSGVRGGRNLPEHLVVVVRALAEARGEDADALAQRAAENTRRLFAWSEGEV